MENKVNELAERLTMQFMSRYNTPELDHEKVYLVYKFINTPTHLIVEGLY